MSSFKFFQDFPLCENGYVRLLPDMFMIFKGAVSIFYVFFVVFVVFCSNVFLYVSTGYISSFKDWMQPYIEI